MFRVSGFVGRRYRKVTLLRQIDETSLTESYFLVRQTKWCTITIQIFANEQILDFELLWQSIDRQSIYKPERFLSANLRDGGQVSSLDPRGSFAVICVKIQSCPNQRISRPTFSCSGTPY
ncbi:hypothetical protein K0M31_004654 [Melipona bicolor]|uniref:Uncharacterized protein n=1 Tax=Melipona bicolor TaxID=60889 RepID=A0AA40FX84_9HYME|nr:hypothetical protein K0M31_004654 [Melipona bicolor]